VVWGNASFGKFLRELFEYQEWVEEFDKTRGRPSLPRRFLPDSNTAEAAGVSVRKTGNSFFGRTTIYMHPALGEFARLPADFRPMTFSSPKVFMPLRLLVNLDELFTPVAHGSGSSLVYLTPYQTNQYLARLEELKRQGREAGFLIRTFGIKRSDDRGGKAVEFTAELTTDDPARGPEAWSTAVRLVVGAFGTDSDIVRVVFDFNDGYGLLQAREIIDTTELTQELAGDDGALDAYLTAHTRRFFGELLQLCDAWEREIEYVDSRWRRLVKEKGATEAVRQLLAKPRVSTAFARLEASGKLELTVEYLILRPEWAPLFTFLERDLAQARLFEHGLPKDEIPVFYT
jgi:hypothetical protein